MLPKGWLSREAMKIVIIRRSLSLNQSRKSKLSKSWKAYLKHSSGKPKANQTPTNNVTKVDNGTKHIEKKQVAVFESIAQKQAEQIMESISETHDASSGKPKANQTPTNNVTKVDNGTKHIEKKQIHNLSKYLDNLTVEETKMRRFDRQTEKQAENENEAQAKPKAEKNQSDDGISKIATLDNGTMVEAFKYLNYCQLTTSSFVSKRFWNLIRTHRHMLALLYVQSIYISKTNLKPADIRIFDKLLSLDAYNEWIIRNHYSKQVLLESQIARKKSTQYDRKVYEFYALTDSNYSHNARMVFETRIDLSNENWPAFQHFVHLFTDPFIYIGHAYLILPPIEVLNLLTGARTLDHNRLQCKELHTYFEANMHKFIKWVKDHVHCDEFRINAGNHPNYDDAFLDFFMTGSNCTSKIVVESYDFCKVVVSFVQKFMYLKSCDENQVVESIWGKVSSQSVEGMKRCYAGFVVKEERNKNDSGTVYVFEFVNKNTGKKLQLTFNTSPLYVTAFSIKIIDL